MRLKENCFDYFNFNFKCYMSPMFHADSLAQP